MKKDKWWLKQEISEIFWRAEIDDNLNIQGANLIFDKIDDAIDQLDEPGEKTTGFANLSLDRYDELLKKEIIANGVIEEYKETLKKTRAVVEKVWGDIKEVAE